MSDKNLNTAKKLATEGVRGGSLILIGSASSFIIQIASLLILSRLLEPSDFGLVAMVAVFIALGSLLRDFGLPMAGLQEKNLSRQQGSNLFWMSSLMALSCAVILGLSTPILVELFDEPRLSTIVPFLASVVFIGGLSSQLQVQLARTMKFGTLTVSDLLGQVLALILAVFLAFTGFGYWALVAQTVTAAVLTLVYRWISIRFIPLRPRRGHDTLRLLKIGATYGIAQLLTFAQNNVGTLLIGAQLGATQLGYYNRAYQLLTAPAGRLLDPLTQVVVSMLNRAKTQERDPNDLLYKIQFGVGALMVWIFAVSAGTAQVLIPFALGDQWFGAIALFQVLAAGGAFWVFNHVSYWAFIVNEKPQALLAYNLVSKPLALASIVIGSQFGALGVAWGYSLAMAISWPLNLIWLNRTAALSATRFGGNGLRILFAGVFCAAVSFSTQAWLSASSPLLALAVAVIAGTLAFVVGLVISPKSRALLMEWVFLMATVVLPRIRVTSK